MRKTAISLVALAPLLCVACTGDPTKDAAAVQGYIVAFQPIASDVACKAQAAANIAGANAEKNGDTSGANTASLFSQGNGLFCNGLPAGAPLPSPVTTPLPPSVLGTAPAATASVAPGS